MAGQTTRVLLVAQLAPPSPLVAARRVAGLTKYLARNGFDVSVLASRISGEGPIEGARDVVRTPDLMASPLNWRRGNLRALSGDEPGAYRRPSWLQSVLVPDVAAATWLPFALPRAIALARGRRPHCVVTTSPLQSAHLIGLVLRRRGLPWIAELRDGWTFDRPADTWPVTAQRRLDEALEREVMTHADAVVCVTEPITDDLRRRFGIEPVVITNGFDPEERVVADADGLLDDGRHSLVYTGRLAHSGRSLQPLLDGLRELRRSDPEAAARLEVVFAGPLTGDEAALLRAADLSGTVRAVGTLERERSLALQRAADSLLVIAKGSSLRSVATAKLFEYLAARKPILVLGEESAAASIVEKAGAGLVTSASDPGAIAASLRRLVDGPLPATTEAAAEAFSYPVIAERYAEVIERVRSR